MIVKYTPQERINEVERLFDSFFGSDRVPAAWAPRVDAKETPTEITFHVELPGMKQEDIDVQFDGKMLSVTGKREFAEQENKDHYVRVERRYGTFERTFTINASVKKDEVTATYKDGILTVVLPKGNGESNHKIAITASEN